MLKSKGRSFLGCCYFLGLIDPLSVPTFPYANPFNIQISRGRTIWIWKAFFPTAVNTILLYICASSVLFCCWSTLKTDRNFAYIVFKLSYTSFKACKGEGKHFGTEVLLLLPRPPTVLQKTLLSHWALPMGAWSETAGVSKWNLHAAWFWWVLYLVKPGIIN